MKKLLLYTILLTTFSAFSQKIPQGTRLVGGDFTFGVQQFKTEREAKNNTLSLGISPLFTKFKKDNFSVSYIIGYNISSSKYLPYKSNIDFYKYSVQNTFMIGTYLKNYKMFNEKLGISLQYGGNIGISSIYINEKNSLNNPSEYTNIGEGFSLNLGTGIGIIYLFNEKIAIEGSTNLVNINVSHNDTFPSQSFSASTGLNGSPTLGFGVRYFYKKKVKAVQEEK